MIHDLRRHFLTLVGVLLLIGALGPGQVFAANSGDHIHVSCLVGQPAWIEYTENVGGYAGTAYWEVGSQQGTVDFDSTYGPTMSPKGDDYKVKLALPAYSTGSINYVWVNIDSHYGYDANSVQGGCGSPP